MNKDLITGVGFSTFFTYFSLRHLIYYYGNNLSNFFIYIILFSFFFYLSSKKFSIYYTKVRKKVSYIHIISIFLFILTLFINSLVVDNLKIVGESYINIHHDESKYYSESNKIIMTSNLFVWCSLILTILVTVMIDNYLLYKFKPKKYDIVSVNMRILYFYGSFYLLSLILIFIEGIIKFSFS